MNSIINHTFVINLKHRNDRWDAIQKSFKNTSLKLQRWNGVYGKQLDEKYIKSITTILCDQFCSYGMIGCWLSHYNLWKYIVENKLDKILILEDDARPVDDFDNRLIYALSDIDVTYDLIYIGCLSCDEIVNDTLKIIGKQNKDVSEHIMIPGFPVGLHAYMISYEGAKKLINSEAMKKVSYHIDCVLANLFNKESNIFKVYALKDQLIYQTGNVSSDIADDEHPSLNYILSKVKVTKNLNMDVLFNAQVLNIRKLGVNVNGYVVLFILISFLFGMFGTINLINYYIVSIVLLNIFDIIMNSNKKINNLILEIVCIIIFLYIGRKFR